MAALRDVVPYTDGVQQGRMESSPIRGISTDTESQIRDGERGRGKQRKGGILHAPFRRVMKRPASDMTRESNCVYNRRRSRLYSRPSWRPRLSDGVQTIHPCPSAYPTGRLIDMGLRTTTSLTLISSLDRLASPWTDHAPRLIPRKRHPDA